MKFTNKLHFIFLTKEGSLKHLKHIYLINSNKKSLYNHLQEKEK